MDERERYDKGMTVRRAVLGDAHVDRTLTRKDAFNEEFQELITRYAWGEIWTRPGLPRHTRSLITVAMMVALNRSDEFRLHRARRLQQRRDARPDQGSVAAGSDLLRRAGGEHGVSSGRGVLRADLTGAAPGAAR